jgi:uncharacterized repeat protein (TIGR03803 family)
MSFAYLKSSWVLAAFVTAMVVLTLAVAAVPAHAQTYTVLYDAPGTPPGISLPTAQAIAQGRDGNLYTTSPSGGTFYGTSFKIAPLGTVTVVNDAITGSPYSGVTLGTDGNFYGTNYDGGLDALGQVYKVTPAGVLTTLHNFINSDGYYPQSAPIEATNGKFYGTTPYSNNSLTSTVYSITSSGTFSTVHTFTNAEGQNVVAGLVQGTDGSFYGVAQTQGANGYGSIFKMTATGTVTVLHNFSSTDGAEPTKPLIQASDGNLYGSTIYGGSAGAGVIFKITPNGTYTVLHNLTSATDGYQPNASLVQATDGKLYGVTTLGGPLSGGTIYSITTTGTFTVLYSFDATNVTNGYEPASPLRQNTNGKFYSDTFYGGTSTYCSGGCGVIYSLDMGLGAFVSLASTSGKEGAKIGIFGQGFSASSVVKFGGTQATTVTRSGTTYLTATVPGAALTGSVTVTTGATTLTSQRTFKVTPTFISFTPPSGPVGTLVTITGTALTQATKVTFNGKSASFTVNSDAQITATVPSGATTGKIAVLTKGGSASSTTSFTVN